MTHALKIIKRNFLERWFASNVDQRSIQLKVVKGLRAMADINTNRREEWQIDKKVPVALIFTLLIQTAGFAFWMGQLSIRIDQLESQNLRYSTNSDRLTRLEVRIDSLTEAVRGLSSRVNP